MLIQFPVGALAYTENEPFISELMAGQYTDVGEVQVWNDGDTLHVTYVIDEPNWCITATHLQVADSLAGIPQTKKGIPIPGKFEKNDEHECVTEVPYTYDLADLGTATELFIAAHAVVQDLDCVVSTALAEFETVLPDTVLMSVKYPYAGAPSYFETTVTDGILGGTYDGWCVDTGRVIYQNADYTANVYSSYEDLPAGTVAVPENLDLVNWIINQGYVGQASACGGNYTYGDVQRAIWTLIDPNSTSGLGSWSQCRVDEILADANANSEGFVPGCDDVIAVIRAPIGGAVQIIIAQVTIIDVGLICPSETGDCDETAWGYGFEFNDDRGWDMYFKYTVQ